MTAITDYQSYANSLDAWVKKWTPIGMAPPHNEIRRRIDMAFRQKIVCPSLCCSFELMIITLLAPTHRLFRGLSEGRWEPPNPITQGTSQRLGNSQVHTVL